MTAPRRTVPPPASPSAQQPIGARLARLWTYFREYRLGWVIAIGGTLVRHILDYAAAQGLKVRPDCPFVKAYIDKHPEYQANSLAHGAQGAA